jgi:hypothetical protein
MRFDRPYNAGQHFKFRVAGWAKKDILRELYSIGYTPERIIRGSKGGAAHKRVCTTIGVVTAAV